MLNIFLFILAYIGCALAGYVFWYLKPWQKFLFVLLLVTWLIFGYMSWIVIVSYLMIFVGSIHGFVALRDQIKEEMHEKQMNAKLHAGELTVIDGGKSS
jgi:hypothetical protein